METRRPDSRDSEPGSERPSDPGPSRDSAESRPRSEERREWKNEEAIFACRLCDSRFSSASLLSWHYHQCHTGKTKMATELARSDYSLPASEGQTYPCVYCWQSFTSYPGLIAHISAAHASAWYQSLATANQLDEYAYMRQFLHERLDGASLPIGSPLTSVTPPVTTSPMMTSPLLTSPIISVADVKPIVSPALSVSNELNRVLFSPSDSDQKQVYKENRVSYPGNASTAGGATAHRPDRVTQHQHDGSDSSLGSKADWTNLVIGGHEQYLCKFCDAVYLTVAEVKEHVTGSHSTEQQQHQKPGGKYECQYCPDAFPLYTALQEHIRCYHGDEYYRRRGRKDTTPPLPPSQKRPMPKSTPPDEDPPIFKCRLCVSGFTENSLLADHYHKIHGVGASAPEPVSAPVTQAPPKIATVKTEPKAALVSAPRSFSNPSTESIELKYICEVCDARFPLYVSMQEHIRTAHGERPFECDVCRKQFTKRCYLLKHLQSHPNTHYDCLHCGRRFVSWTQRRDHMMQHEIEGVFLCTHCGSRFTLQRHLEQHLRTHADATHILVCVDCNEKFEDSLEFQEHVRSHVRCPYCSQVFDTNKNLVEHIETTHQKAKLQARLQQPQEVKKPQKSVAPVPKTKVNSPAKTRAETATTGSASTISTTSSAASTITSSSAITTSSANPFGSGIAPMYVWMPGSHFPAAVFPTLSIVSPQLTAMQALNESLMPEQSNLMGYPAYALPYPYPGSLMVPPRTQAGDMSPVAPEAPKRRRTTPELEAQQIKKAKTTKRVSPVAAHDSRRPDERLDETRHRYGTLIDHLSLPPKKASVSLQCDMNESAAAGPVDASSEQFVCKTCAEILPTQESLSRHQEDHADDGSKPLNLSTRSVKEVAIDMTQIKTEHCDDSETKRDVMDGHRRKMELGNKPPITREMLMQCEITPVGSDFFRCEICMSIISNLHLVEKHLNEHFLAQQIDDEAGITFTCGKCRVSFTQRSEFFYHLLKNHTDDNYYQCTICKKKFITERFLDKHMNVHLLAQNFTCQFCSKGFYLADVCNRHERLHLQYGDKPKPPGIPNKDLVKKSLPSAAAGSASPTESQTLNSPTPANYRLHVYAMYKCQSCQMEFSHKRQIKQHLKDSACALDDNTSLRHYTKFYKCKLCHSLFDDCDRVSICQHMLIRHQFEVDSPAITVGDLPGSSGPKSDNSSTSESTVASFQEFYSSGDAGEHQWVQDRSMSQYSTAETFDDSENRNWMKGHGVAQFPERASYEYKVRDGHTAGRQARVDCVCHVCGMAFPNRLHFEAHTCDAKEKEESGEQESEENSGSNE